MDVSDLLLTDQIPPGSPALVVNFTGGGTVFGGVVVRFPSEVPILVSFGGEGVEIVNEINVEGDTGSVDHVQTLQLHKSTNPITGFNVLPGDPNTAIANFSSSFLELTDTPDIYTGQGDKLVSVKGDETGLEFINPSVPLTFSDSVLRTVNDVTLVGDSNSPGNLKYYGTDLSGAKGYHVIANVGDPIINAYRDLGSSIFAQTIGQSIMFINNTATYQMVSQRVVFIAVYLATDQTLHGVKWFQVTLGNYVANNNNKIGLYSYSSGTLTLVASCVNDGTLWKTATSSSYGSAAFSSTYNATAGTYFVALLYCRSSVTTEPVLGSGQYFNVIGVSAPALDFTNSAKLAGLIPAQTDLPSPTQAMSGVTGHSGAVLPWVAVY